MNTNTLVKRIVYIALTFIVLLIIATFTLSFWFNPNDYKPLINENLTKFLKTEVEIKGDMSWKLWPSLRINIEDIIVKNNPTYGDSNFITVPQLQLEAALKPLLSGKVSIERLKVIRPNIHLVKLSKEKNNWSGLTNSSSTLSSQTASKAGQKKATDKTNQSRFELYMNAIQIYDGEIYYENKINNKKYQLSALDLLFKSTDTTQNKLTLNANIVGEEFSKGSVIEVDAHIKPNDKKHLYQVKPFGLKVIGTPVGDIAFESNLDLKLQNKNTVEFNATEMHVNIDGENVNGTVNVVYEDQLNLKIDLQAERFNLDKILNASNKNKAKLAAANGNSVQSKQTTNSKEKDFAWLNNISIDGKITFNTLIVQNIPIKTPIITINGENGLMLVKLDKGTVFGGSVYTKARLDTSKSTPKWWIEKRLHNLPMDPIYKALGKTPHMVGLLSSDWQINTQGWTQKKMYQHMNGTMIANITDGYFAKLDIPFFVQQAENLIKKRPNVAENTGRTKIDKLSASGVIRNGILDNRDLVFVSGEYSVQGQGIVNFANETLDYQVQAQKTVYLKDNTRIPLALRVSGLWDSPKVVPDLDAYSKALLKGEISKQQDKIKQKLDKKLKKNLDDKVKKLFSF